MKIEVYNHILEKNYSMLFMEFKNTDTRTPFTRLQADEVLAHDEGWEGTGLRH